jgi:hypothetical protein
MRDTPRCPTPETTLVSCHDLFFYRVNERGF